jgi:hypothetical protein
MAIAIAASNGMIPDDRRSLDELRESLIRRHDRWGTAGRVNHAPQCATIVNGTAEDAWDDVERSASEAIWIWLREEAALSFLFSAV